MRTRARGDSPRRSARSPLLLDGAPTLAKSSRKTSTTFSTCAFVLTSVSLAVGLASGCTSFGANEADPPATQETRDAAGEERANLRPSDDSGAPVDASEEEASSAPCPPGSAPAELALVASADTTVAGECNGQITYGSDTFLHIGFDNGVGVGLVRFALSDQDTVTLSNSKILGGRLKLFAYPNCPACMPSLPTKQGQLSVHSMRPDWDEGTSGGAGAGADRCRRATGKGWGSDRPPGPNTEIAGAGGDFDDGPDTTAVPDDADEVTIFLGADTITARGSIAAQRIAFLLRMVSGGRMIVATREKSAAEAAHLVITYCQ